MLRAAVFIAALALAAPSADARTIALAAIDSGWVAEDDSRGPATNYFAGRCLGCTAGELEIRNYFVFDLSMVGRPIESAVLVLDSGSRFSNTGRPSQTFALHDVRYDPMQLIGAGGVHPGVFDDLGTGQLLGTAELTMRCCEPQATIPLNDAAIALLDDADGLFALGGRVTSLGPPSEDVRLFGGTHNPPNDRYLLITAVPEPGAWCLFVTGLLIVGSRRSARRARPRA